MIHFSPAIALDFHLRYASPFSEPTACGVELHSADLRKLLQKKNMLIIQMGPNIFASDPSTKGVYQPRGSSPSSRPRKATHSTPDASEIAVISSFA